MGATDRRQGDGEATGKESAGNIVRIIPVLRKPMTRANTRANRVIPVHFLPGNRCPVLYSLATKGLSGLKTHKRLLGSALRFSVPLTGLARWLVHVNAPLTAVSRLASGAALRVDTHTRSWCDTSVSPAARCGWTCRDTR